MRRCKVLCALDASEIVEERAHVHRVNQVLDCVVRPDSSDVVELDELHVCED